MQDTDSKRRRRNRGKHYMEDTTSESTDGGNPGRRIVIIRVSASDIFLKSDCRSVCSGNFFRGEDDGSAGNDIFPGEICFCIFLYVDHCCICGCTYFHWIYPVVVQENDTYGNPSCGWNHDWIYLLGNY